MSTDYVETPYNFSDIAPFVLTDKRQIVQEFYSNEKCYFYDACSFRKHAQMTNPQYLFDYVKNSNGMFVITGCVLMELASKTGVLHQNYIRYFQKIYHAGIKSVIFPEEYVFDVMDVCFSTNAKINSYLFWAIQVVKHPTSIIEETLKNNSKLYEELSGLKDIKDKNLYKRFFSAVRNNKESDDNLGEELITICVHILSNIIGEEDGKYCILTEDKGAIGLISSAFEKTNPRHRGKKIILYTTPKLVQHMYDKNAIPGENAIKEMIAAGVSGNIVVLGMDEYDIKGREIPISCADLAKEIVTPNGIHIIY